MNKWPQACVKSSLLSYQIVKKDISQKVQNQDFANTYEILAHLMNLKRYQQ